MRHIIGMDLASEVTTVAILNKSGRVLHNTAIATSEENFKQLIKSFKGPKQVVFEECGLSAWLYAALEPFCEDVFVCNPKKSKGLSGKAKSDDADAVNLAKRAQLGDLSRVWHGGKELQALKDKLRDYQELTTQSTALQNKIKAIFRNRGINVGSKAYNPETRPEALQLLKQEELRRRVVHLGNILDVVQVQRFESQKLLIKGARKNDMFKPLLSIPHIGGIFAATLIGETGTPYRFRTRKQFWSYSGLAVTTYDTSQYYLNENGVPRKKERKANTRGLVNEYNRSVKNVFKHIALGMAAKEWSHESRRLQKSGVSIANSRLTLARKAAAATLRIMKTGETYDEKLVFARE